ncbi:MAG: MFS transporter, partial [Nitrospiraceae bacterium]
DIAFDAYRTDVLTPTERGFGAAVSVTGYRLAMLVSGALALILADHIGWRTTYLFMAALMLVGMAGTLLSREPIAPPAPPRSLTEAAWGPIREFFSRSPALALLVLIVLYKIGDAFAGSLTTAFLIRGVDFSPSEVGVVNKGMGLLATLLGALAGGALMVKLGLFRSLLLFGILQAVSNLSFMLLAWVGKSYPIMVGAIAFENLAGGMGTAAFVALLMSLCDHRYTATQYALLSALAALGRVFVGPPSGYLVEAVGWVIFFLVTFFAALPGLWVLWRMKGYLERQATRE